MPAKVTDEQKAKVLDAVGKGVHPQVACTAANLSTSYWTVLRSRAKAGDPVAIEFHEAILAAQAQSECHDVEAAHRATLPVNDRPIICPQCDHEYSAEPEQLAALAMREFDAQRAKSAAADVALKKLERRFPQRWSQKVIHTVQEEHQRLLDVCERLLAPEVFNALCEEYLAGDSGESETRIGSSEPAEDRTH